MAKAQGTWPLRAVESSVLHVAVGTRMLVEMTWPCPMGFLTLLCRVGVTVTVLLAYSDLCPTSLFASLAYTYLMSLDSPKSQICLQMNIRLLR